MSEFPPGHLVEKFPLSIQKKHNFGNQLFGNGCPNEKIDLSYDFSVEFEEARYRCIYTNPNSKRKCGATFDKKGNSHKN